MNDVSESLEKEAAFPRRLEGRRREKSGRRRSDRHRFANGAQQRLATGGEGGIHAGQNTDRFASALSGYGQRGEQSTAQIVLPVITEDSVLGA